LNEERGRKWRVHDSDRLPSCTLVALERHKSEQALNLETRRPEGTVILKRSEGCNRSISGVPEMEQRIQVEDD